MANKITAGFSDIDHAQLRILLGNRAYGKGILAVHGTNVENVKTTAAVPFSINGIMYSLAATAEFDLSALAVLDEKTGAATTLTAQATAYSRAYLLALNSSGTAHIIQGTAVLTADVTAGTKSVVCPACPPTLAPFAAIKVVNASGSAFTLGTTLLSAVTATYFDVAIAPATL
jgi:hypothetical protein